MHRLATVHARDNQPTNQRRHDTAYLNKRLFYWRKVRRLKMKTDQRNKVFQYLIIIFEILNQMCLLFTRSV